MKRLILMRHAKSDWSGGATTDHARALNARGRESAAALGKWMRETGLHPDQVLCSSAERTQETLALLQVPADVKTDLLRALYLAEPQKILSLLRKATGEVVLIIGHNPGIGEMAARLLHDLPSDQRFHNYPTGATLVADFHVDEWKKASWGIAQLAHFVVPRDL
jgi:phosphohistidine phosphatase